MNQSKQDSWRVKVHYQLKHLLVKPFDWIRIGKPGQFNVTITFNLRTRLVLTILAPEEQKEMQPQ
ncbi:uncharacterized protein METZ01_LOCUS28569 [marine metagenome]|uniref:Uncharacterized protein n=1 Tax=marine metagenome TaxID=408172 RepID=A0A381Q8P4_9ZZZZ|nr:hypothetical protein [Chloroflexota bacterium]